MKDGEIMEVSSINDDGSYNKEFYGLLSEGKLTGITQRFDFEYDISILEGLLLIKRKENINEQI